MERREQLRRRGISTKSECLREQVKVDMENRTYGRSKRWSWAVGLFGGVGLFAAGCWLVIGSFYWRPEYDAPVAAYLAVLFGVLGVVSAFRYRVTVGDTFLEVRDIRTKRVAYGEVTSVELHLHSLKLRSSKGSVRIGSEIEEREELYEVIAKKLNPYDVGQIKGMDALRDRYSLKRLT